MTDQSPTPQKAGPKPSIYGPLHLENLGSSRLTNDSIIPIGVTSYGFNRIASNMNQDSSSSPDVSTTISTTSFGSNVKPLLRENISVSPMDALLQKLAEARVANQAAFKDNTVQLNMNAFNGRNNSSVLPSSAVATAGQFDAIDRGNSRFDSFKAAEFDRMKRELENMKIEMARKNEEVVRKAKELANRDEELANREVELANKQEHLANKEEELAQTTMAKLTLEQALGPVDDDQPKIDVTENTISRLQNSLNAATRPSNAVTPAAFAESMNIWGNGSRSAMDTQVRAASSSRLPAANSTDWNALRPLFNGASEINSGQPGMGVQNIQAMTLHLDNRRPALQLMNNGSFGGGGGGGGGGGDATSSLRRLNSSACPGSARLPNTAWSLLSSSSHNISPPSTPLGVSNSGAIGAIQTTTLQVPRVSGSRLSPTAAEFNYDVMPPSTPWNAQIENNQDIAALMGGPDSVNYRRLLDRGMTCDWKYLVDKIVASNDQQASIFLQQKLKVGTQQQKFDICEAILSQCYPLMINRFGNFLVQRCLEHGSHEQIDRVAKTIRGNVLTLSMDSFGCHVIQKAFDIVPEEYKAAMVHELLRRIPETVIHRYACHVWQKLFELRWNDSPPQIMKYVNEALRGMWHEVALGETGSLVVQNIFENCLEEDKRSCINEVLNSIDIVAHGQFGNWCIQHICEHGALVDRARATDHIIRLASEYSMDQYASKVVEKCLKIGGHEFLDRYLQRVCEARSDRPRIPLIDIAGDQFGNYLVQWVLAHASAEHRELVASHIRKHMVSLRGSKYGSRVAMLCTNTASQIRPGPPSGLPNHRYNGVGGGRGNFGGYR